MNCTSCKNYKRCDDIRRSEETCFAEYCSLFIPRSDSKAVKIGDYVVIQMGVNNHIVVINSENNVVMHVNCKEELTEEEIREKYEWLKCLIKTEHVKEEAKHAEDKRQ